MATRVEMGELRADTPCGRAAKVKAQLRSVELRAPRVPRNPSSRASLRPTSSSRSAASRDQHVTQPESKGALEVDRAVLRHAA